jgi:hypothetical protein
VSSSEFNALHIIHIAAALMLVGYTFLAFAADPSRRKKVLMWSGIAAVIVLLSGIRMWQAQFAFVMAGWIWVKVICWAAISALSGIGFRRRAQAGVLAFITILIVTLAVAMAYTKPF